MVSVPDLGGAIGGLGGALGGALGGLLNGFDGLVQGTFGAAGTGLVAGLGLVAAALVLLWIVARR